MDAGAIGHRALAVNLSDLAAMGAEPAWASLSMSLPDADSSWIESFASGFHALAARWGVSLVGGDTVRGPLSVSVHLSGFVEPGAALTRRGAKPGELVYVTGMPGEAMAGLKMLEDGRSPSSVHLERRFTWPEPRVAEGLALRGLASAAIDLSDGLGTDLGRLAEASGVRISVRVEDLPVSREIADIFGEAPALSMTVCGGDDYELVFSVPPQREDRLLEAAEDWSCPLTRIGRVEAGAGLAMTLEGRPYRVDLSGAWRHFEGGET
jgi:thiamine-monophosphate kinase